MKTQNLSVRAVTSIRQKLPTNWEEKIAFFGLFNENAIIGVNFKDISNMHEISIGLECLVDSQLKH